MTAKDQGSKSATAEGQLIRELAELLNDTGLTEIEIEKSGLKIRVAKSIHMTAPVGPAYAVAAGTHATQSPAIGSESSGEPPSGGGKDPSKHPGAVKSPMVGTAYCSPEPGSAPFVQVGSKVKQGQTVLIIEAMKTMNQIPAPRDGTVTAVFVENAQPVEYGEPLIIIE